MTPIEQAAAVAERLDAIDALCTQVNYDPETGAMTWRAKKSADAVSAAWNRRYAGTAVGYRHPSGYMVVMFSFRGKKHKIYMHLVAWTARNGRAPAGMQVDHINHVRSDNAARNLRIVNQFMNMRNRPMRSDNTSGHSGVFWSKCARRWVSQVTFDGRAKHLGCFLNKSDAVETTKRFYAENGFHGNHGKPEAPAATGRGM